MNLVTVEYISVNYLPHSYYDDGEVASWVCTLGLEDSIRNLNNDFSGFGQTELQALAEALGCFADYAKMQHTEMLK